MKVPILDLAAQYVALREELESAVEGVLASGRFILDSEVQALEHEIGELLGAPHAVACASGSDALLLALMALDIGPGDEVITSPFTFFSTAGSIHRLGARPVFADIEPDTFNLDPEQVARRLSPRTRAVVPVHLFGRLARMEPILEVCAPRRIAVIEDAAQAFGARAGGRAAGTFGVLGCFSFYPTKNLGGAGDGGMLVTGDGALAERLRRLRAHGAADNYYHDEVGLNSRLDELQAAILRVKLRHIDEWNLARRRHAEAYDRLLGGVAQIPSPAPPGAHVYHRYTVRVPHRDGVRQRLAASGIESAIYYPVPLHLQKCFVDLGYKAGDFPCAEAAARDVLSLPIYPELSSEALHYVADTVRAVVQPEAARAAPAVPTRVLS